MEQRSVLSAGANRGPRLTREHVRARFGGAVPADGERMRRRGDADLNPGLKPKQPLVGAGVLVPLVERPEGLTVLLTRRTAHLHAHAGQISFPGGRLEERDADPCAAALREAEEEVGLARARVTPIGCLDIYVTRTGFEVTPVVALVDPPPAFTPDPFEVAEVFEVPLEFVLDPANHQRHSRNYAGALRQFYVLPWRHYYIWGATAGMLVNLADVLKPEP